MGSVANCWQEIFCCGSALAAAMWAVSAAWRALTQPARQEGVGLAVFLGKYHCGCYDQGFGISSDIAPVISSLEHEQ